ncbi:LytR/AlgR family response regulator transcription factor [Flavihumibacter petaseus]|uniref:Putative two-component response regulator n=1 Tax=Flavihumibacter petaseus NBRC 106054 TaxID=1220578 RepID=A0A0E9MY52_9BACT|nr:LytTR family DNA-binding domain-containing protein [Flavihumibacter petaseus]GAO42514.1 putative two-component response regulator [Flavihumibacter petaseus NBRC 106054]
MKVLIVDGEKLAAKRLIRLLGEIEPGAVILEWLDSVEEAIAWLQQHPPPEMIFMDIALSEGSGLDILQQVTTNSAIIFITALDTHAIRAFRYNSIDYLLKPLRREQLEQAIQKWKSLHRAARKELQLQHLQLEDLVSNLKEQARPYKSRFLVKKATRMFSIDTAEVALVYKKGRDNFIKTFSGADYLIDNHLDEIETQLDPDNFFRVNRQFIAHYRSIHEVYPWFDGKLKLTVTPSAYEDIVISRLRANDFKKWLGK